MAEGNNSKNDTVGLFLRAMVDREPGKRKVKPSKAALIDLAELDLGESSDDSDFNVDEAKLKEDDDISINSDPDDDDEEDDNDDSDEEEEGDHANENCKTVSNAKETRTISELLAHAQEKQAIAAEQGINRPKILVCAICLGEYSDDTNEIVTCDGCHVSVHEGCYGISDTISVSSTVSSSSTEPWFCDACKAGVSNPPCELCPNLGYTIFKETEMGRWVHLVCALYVPGVAFSEVDKLSFPTLFEMPYSRYGAKTCSLCEDERYCKTGVCIGCDAGMCRSYFHVTCAQREGLLSEVNHGEADQADPYYAHCKLHTDRELMRRRKRNWLALQLHMKQGEKEKLSESQETQDRLQRKLMKYREKYMFVKASKPAPWFPTQKMPRSLSTCASFFRSVLHKTKLMGVETESSVQEPQSLGDVRKKWNISPAFNVEFISYYLDRTSRLQEMKSKLDFLLKENDELRKEEIDLRNQYNKMKVESQTLETENAELLNKALEIHDLLKGLAGRPLRLPPVVAALHNPPYVDVEVTNIPGVTGGLGKEKRLITKAAAKMMSGSIPVLSSGMDGNTSFKSSTVKSSPSSSNFSSGDNASVMSIHTCSVCQLTKDQHLLIQCDTCSNYYHLSCLDPPLTRMPKKTKQMGWQCSDCCKSSDSDKAPEIDTTAPRRLRRIIKEPSKFSPSVTKDQKGENERISESDGKTTTPSGEQSSKGKAASKGAKKGAVKRRLSSDSNKRGTKKIRRRSLDSPRKGNKSVKEESPNSGDMTSISEDHPPAKMEVSESKLKSDNEKGSQLKELKVEVTSPKQEVNAPKVETSTPKKKGTLVKPEAQNSESDPRTQKSEAPGPKPETQNVEVRLEVIPSHKFEVPPKIELPTPKIELQPISEPPKLEGGEDKAPPLSSQSGSSPRTPTRSSSRTKRGGTDSPQRPELISQMDNKTTPVSEAASVAPQAPSAPDGGSAKVELLHKKEQISTEEKKSSSAPTPAPPAPITPLPPPPLTTTTAVPPAFSTSTTTKSTDSTSTPLSISTSSSSSASSLTTSSVNNHNNNNNNNNGNNTSLDMSADSLPSPHSESFPSEEDPLGPSRRERRHREGGKKKKKDRDKEDGGRKRKKHHRERHPLAEMASEMVSPFRIKIKPLPPRPNGNEGHPTAPVPSDFHVSNVSTHTTSTTTAPPGYPPLPPGYKLTQPMTFGSTVSLVGITQERVNGSNNRTQEPITTATSTISSSTSIPTASIASTITTSSAPSTISSTTVVATAGATRPSVGRRKSDPVAEQFSKCDVCGETGGVTNTVMCDECLKAYHFNCLEPPLKKSPKRRGYSWFCEDCDNAVTTVQENKG